jgi:hypothetical protein
MFTGSDHKTCAKMVEVLKAFFKEKALQLVREADQQPILCSYGSDATSLLCQATETALLDGSRVARQGKVLLELLMERGFLKTRTFAGQEKVALSFRDPLPLGLGKNAWNLFTAGTLFFPMLREIGHRGVSIFHLCEERAVFQALDRMFRQRHKAYYTPGLGPDLGDEAILLFLCDWFVSTGCGAHDVQSALKWALAPHASVEDLKDLHIVMESLRNSFAILHARMPRFLISHLAFDQSPFDRQVVAAFWRALGVEAAMVDKVVEVNPWWDGNFLWVNGELEDDPNAIAIVSGVLLYIFRWRQFTDSRWVTIGPSCRALLGSLCVGLEKLVLITRADPKATDYHLHGFSRLTSRLRKYAAIASIASFPADAVLLELLEDDRCVRNIAKLEEALADELLWVANIGSFTWVRLAKVVCDAHCSDNALRASTVHATYVEAAFVDNKLFKVVRGLPWKLALGDIGRNLDELAGSHEEITDSCAHQIRELLRHNLLSRFHLECAVALFRDIPWTTVPVEQAHGSSAVLRC